MYSPKLFLSLVLALRKDLFVAASENEYAYTMMEFRLFHYR